MALTLLDELDSSYPVVCKVPGVYGGYIRVCVSINCPWYRAFTKQYLWRSSKRYPKPRTIIKRQHVRKALKRIARGNLEGVYAERLLVFIRNWPVPKRKRRVKLEVIPL